MTADEGTPPSARTDVRIRVCDLGKSYGTLEVFRGVNLEVGDAEIVAIVGPSGCGKTTLLIPHSAGRQAGKKLTVILDVNQVIPVNHYLLLTTTRKS